MTARRWGASVVVLAVVSVAGCGGSGDGVTVRAGSPAQQAPGLRSTFEKLLGHHATLVVRMTRAQIRGDPDVVEAAEAALVANTSELRSGISAAFGEEAGDAFEPLWRRHTELLADYATATVDGDDDRQRAASASLDAYRAEYGAFIETTTGGAIGAGAAADNLRLHLDHLTGQIDAFAAGDFERAVAIQREAFRHMFPTAGALVGAATPTPPGELPVQPDASEQLLSTLGMLLGEHFELAVDTMRFGVRGDEGFEAAAAALDANSRELTGAFDTLFGPERARAFNEAWAEHIDHLVHYTGALAEDDERARAEAVSALEPARTRQAETLSQLTGGRLSVGAALLALTVHDEQLIHQIDAYAAEDYETAHRLAFEGYGHMFETAAALAPAIEAELSTALPVGGVQTGGGGTAPPGP